MKHNDLPLTVHNDSRIKISRRDAYHLAGHAAAIYLANKQKQLPSVFFQIVLKPHEVEPPQFNQFTSLYCKYKGVIEGGLLIQSFPLPFTETVGHFSESQQLEYRLAFEADVINQLSGPLAEAKYVALRDNEVLSANLINLNSLHYYGGNLALIQEYLKRYLPNKEERERKLRELFLAAYKFVNKRSNWDAITSLAEFIQEEPNTIISCEEVISLLEFRLLEV